MQESVELLNTTESFNSAKLNNATCNNGIVQTPTDEDRSPTDDASSSRVVERKRSKAMGLVALAKKTSRSFRSARSKKSFGSVKSHESSLTANESVPMKEVEEDLLTVASEASKAASINEAPFEEVRDSVEELVAPTESVVTSNDEASVKSSTSSKASKKKSKKAVSMNEAPSEEVRESVNELVTPAESVVTSNDEASVKSSTSSKASKKKCKKAASINEAPSEGSTRLCQRACRANRERCNQQRRSIG